MILSSSDEHGTHPGVHPSAHRRRWRVRLSPAVELEAAAFSWGLASWIAIRGFSGTTHSWMINIASEPAWTVLFTMLGLVLAAAAWLRTGTLRMALLCASLALYAALSVAASRHGTAMGLSCAFTVHTMFLFASFRRSR